MVRFLLRIEWTKRSQRDMKGLFDFIASDSPQSAAKVIEDIFGAMTKACDNPEIYPADKYRRNNNGSYRAFEKHSYRIAYRYTEQVIIVLRVRHTRKDPLQY